MTANRFSLIAFEDQDTDTFEELVASPASHGRAPSKKVSQKSLPIANVPGKSSLEKVSNLLILKKQQEQEEIARAAARAAEVERRAQGMLAQIYFAASCKLCFCRGDCCSCYSQHSNRAGLSEERQAESSLAS